MNYLIALETSGKAGSVALVDRRQPTVIMATIRLPEDQGSAQSLVPCVHQLLTETNLTTADLGCIALLSGPGSFTGLRVGVATAKTLGYALKIPLVELDTLDVIHRQLRTKLRLPDLYVHCVLDAYRGQLFVKTYFPQEQSHASDTNVPDEMRRHEQTKSSTRVVDIDQFLLEVMASGAEASKNVFAGPGCDRLKRFLGKEGSDGPWKEWLRCVLWEGGDDLFPQASTVAQLGVTRWTEGCFVDAFKLLPHYYRASAAEEKVKVKPN